MAATLPQQSEQRRASYSPYSRNLQAPHQGCALGHSGVGGTGHCSVRCGTRQLQLPAAMWIRCAEAGESASWSQGAF